MAETEIERTLGCVREAETQVTVALQQSGLTQPQRDLLCELAETLRDLDAQLVIEDLKSRAGALEEKAKRLTRLNEETQEKLQALEDVAEVIGKVAKAVNGLVKGVGLVV